MKVFVTFLLFLSLSGTFADISTANTVGHSASGPSAVKLEFDPTPVEASPPQTTATATEQPSLAAVSPDLNAVPPPSTPTATVEAAKQPEVAKQPVPATPTQPTTATPAITTEAAKPTISKPSNEQPEIPTPAKQASLEEAKTTTNPMLSALGITTKQTECNAEGLKNTVYPLAIFNVFKFLWVFQRMGALTWFGDDFYTNIDNMDTDLEGVLSLLFRLLSVISTIIGFLGSFQSHFMTVIVCAAIALVTDIVAGLLMGKAIGFKKVFNKETANDHKGYVDLLILPIVSLILTIAVLALAVPCLPPKDDGNSGSSTTPSLSRS